MKWPSDVMAEEGYWKDSVVSAFAMSVKQLAAVVECSSPTEATSALGPQSSSRMTRSMYWLEERFVTLGDLVQLPRSLGSVWNSLTVLERDL
jgi:hypothetical protein